MSLAEICEMTLLDEAAVKGDNIPLEKAIASFFKSLYFSWSCIDIYDIELLAIYVYVGLCS